MTADEMVEHKVRNELGRLFVLNAVYEANLQAANNMIAELTAERDALKKESETHASTSSSSESRTPSDGPDAASSVTAAAAAEPRGATD